MFRGTTWQSTAAFGAGLALGLAVALGYWLGNSSTPEVRLQAMSGYGSENMGMVSGPVDDNAEGVFTLDYPTGELRCFVVNPKTGTFGAGFSRNIVADLGVERGKKPAFVMSTGVVNFRGFSGSSRPANCVVYVADGNTGRFAGYVVPWTPGAFAANINQLGEMKLLVKGEARPVEVRE